MFLTEFSEPIPGHSPQETFPNMLMNAVPAFTHQAPTHSQPRDVSPSENHHHSASTQSHTPLCLLTWPHPLLPLQASPTTAPGQSPQRETHTWSDSFDSQQGTHPASHTDHDPANDKIPGAHAFRQLGLSSISLSGGASSTETWPLFPSLAAF